MSLIRSCKRDSLRGCEKVSDKILYPTVNSLALKRTRLPLQLHDGGTDIETQEEMKKDSGPHRESKRTSLMAKGKGNPFRKYRAKIEMMVERRNEIFESAESAEITTNILTDSERDEELLYSSKKEYKKERMADWPLEEKKNENVKANIRNESNDDSSVLSERRCSYSSEDYEKVDVKSQCYPEAFVERDFDVNESFHRKKITGISKSTCDRESILFSSDEEKSSLRNNKKKKKKKKKKKRQFARYVLHYVPGYPGKRHKQPTKKKKKHYRFVTSFDSRARSLGEEDETSIEENQEFSRPRSLSRFELKYVMISAPSNFVHVASATNTRLMSNEKIASSKLEQSIITHEEKSANLPLLLRGKEVDKSINRLIGEETPMETLRHVNEGRTPYVEIKRTSLGNAEERKVELVDPCRSVKIETDDHEMRISYEPILRTNVSFLWSDRTRNFLDNKNEQARLSSSLVENDEETFAGTFEEPYDDVGPPLSKSFSQEDDYDDVGPPPTCSDENTPGDGKYAKDDTYDDVLVPFLNKIEEKVETILEDDDRQESSINNDYSSLEDGEDERYIYDDVAVPVGEERVNSLYGDSMAASFMGSVLTNGKESEWEDVDDFTNALPCYCQHDCTCEKNGEQCNTWSKKKTGQRSGKKWKRRRSRRCRKTSASSARTRHDSIVDESASEDSTYESLRFCQPDDFGTDSESETSGRVNGPNLNAENRGENTTNGNVYLEAPAKPIPPPPRESSLTETLGRRIKMLRRTWSITKGSLGRIRRRTLFVEEEQASEESKDLANVHHQQQLPDNGKYFSFRKHFRKNLTSFSTFYLNDSDGICTSRNNNNNNGTSKEAIYGNTNWYAAWSGTTKINNDCESSSRDVDHYSVLADQEPLYQFYEAAVARVAFESDSDGYEEVEDLNFPPLATEDFLKPGQRTLWCQTPQVVRSGLLQRLTPEEKKIQEAKFEILTSEASYLNSLRVLDNEFLRNHELTNEILTSSEKDKLFGGVPAVIKASERLLADLEIIWKEDPTLNNLPDILLKHSDKYLDIFVGYCSNQIKIDMTLKELRARKGGSKFVEAVAQIESRPECQSLPLNSFLMLPMQRITRLPLLADAVLSKLSVENTADRSSWEKVLSTFTYVASECNEGARAAAQEAEMEMITRKLEYSAKIKTLALKNRRLIKKGPVIRLTMKADMEYKLTFGKKFNKTPLYLFLLTDYLLVTKIKHNSTHDEAYIVTDVCKRNLLALETVSEDSPFAGRNAMMLTLLENYSGKQAEYVLTCESNTERERWLEAISPPKRETFGETLYEAWDCPQVMALYSYSPSQPDELTLQPGDVINVMRKMTDGWYHGEKLLNGEQGWFPANYTKEVASEHVRARNLKQRHRLLALTGSVLQRRAKQNLADRLQSVS